MVCLFVECEFLCLKQVVDRAVKEVVGGALHQLRLCYWTESSDRC